MGTALAAPSEPTGAVLVPVVGTEQPECRRTRAVSSSNSISLSQNRFGLAATIISHCLPRPVGWGRCPPERLRLRAQRRRDGSTSGHQVAPATRGGRSGPSWRQSAPAGLGRSPLTATASERPRTRPAWGDYPHHRQSRGTDRSGSRGTVSWQQSSLGSCQENIPGCAGENTHTTHLPTPQPNPNHSIAKLSISLTKEPRVRTKESFKEYF